MGGLKEGLNLAPPSSSNPNLRQMQAFTGKSL